MRLKERYIDPTYLNVGSEPGVDPVGSQHVGQRGGAGEGGGYSVAHFGQRQQLEAELLVKLLQLFVRLLLALAQDAAHHVAAFLHRPLKGRKKREGRERMDVKATEKTLVLIFTTVI